MPELPEVETVRRGLQELLIGRVIQRQVHDTPKGFPNTDQDVQTFLIGAAVTAVRRRAKVLLIELSTGYSLVIHLKMTGQLVFVGAGQRFGAGHPTSSLIDALPDKSTRVTLSFTDGSDLFFNDQRKFGWMKLMATALVPELPFMQKLGPEPLEAAFTPEVFATRLQRRARSGIKAVLLDQSVVAGIGNIYADEGLWGAKIHPDTKVGDLSPDQIVDLHQALRSVMSLAIEKGGSSNHTYLNAKGERGKYMDFARVYGQTGKPCPRCGTEIYKFKTAGRGTHICPVCQVLS